MPAEWKVTVRGTLKGEIFKRHARWAWSLDTRGVETWPESTTRADVVAFIARVCRADPSEVKLEPCGRSAAKPVPGHKLAGTSYGVRVSCECGWRSNTWYGQGARRNALGEWRSHQERACHAA